MSSVDIETIQLLGLPFSLVHGAAQTRLQPLPGSTTPSENARSDSETNWTTSPLRPIAKWSDTSGRLPDLKNDLTAFSGPPSVCSDSAMGEPYGRPPRHAGIGTASIWNIAWSGIGWLGHVRAVSRDCCC